MWRSLLKLFDFIKYSGTFPETSLIQNTLPEDSRAQLSFTSLPTATVLVSIIGSEHPEETSFTSTTESHVYSHINTVRTWVHFRMWSRCDISTCTYAPRSESAWNKTPSSFSWCSTWDWTQTDHHMFYPDVLVSSGRWRIHTGGVDVHHHRGNLTSFYLNTCVSWRVSTAQRMSQGLLYCVDLKDVLRVLSDWYVTHWCSRRLEAARRIHRVFLWLKAAVPSESTTKGSGPRDTC